MDVERYNVSKSYFIATQQALVVLASWLKPYISSYGKK